MGRGFSKLCSCFELGNREKDSGTNQPDQQDGISARTETFDRTLGHSFRYVRSSARFISPAHSDRFVSSPSNSLRFSPTLESVTRARPDYHETGFKAISGASVSANSSTSKSVLQQQDIDDGANDDTAPEGGAMGCIVSGFESTSSFRALPLQPAPRGETHFLSGPMERSVLSGPLEEHNAAAESGRDVPFSAPLGGFYTKKKRAFSQMRKAFHWVSSEKKQPGELPVLNSVGRKEAPLNDDMPKMRMKRESHEQWALGKAGEDGAHVVVSEEHGWVFVGIYDGFNGPDAPEFLMCHLYQAVYNELEGLFWEVEDAEENSPSSSGNTMLGKSEESSYEKAEGTESMRRRLWEYFEEDDHEDGADLSGSKGFSFYLKKSAAEVSKRWLPSKLKHRLPKQKDKVEAKKAKLSSRGGRTRKKVGPVDHDLVLRALSRALESTEAAYLDMTDKFIDSNPELALMGSCVLVVIMRDEDVYVMNVGDSRAIVAQYRPRDELKSPAEGLLLDEDHEGEIKLENEDSCQEMRLAALQLSTDHNTSNEEEVIRIKNEHPDDSHSIVNGRVKGHLLVTRAFGAGFLKQPKWNEAVLEVFRTDYVGRAPYISCSPSLCHHRLSKRDKFLIVSSDGLYQFQTNQQVVSQVHNVMDKFPHGDLAAQHLIHELLLRAANKAGMEVNELLDIPQGERRKYHDDVTVTIISLEDRNCL